MIDTIVAQLPVEDVMPGDTWECTTTTRGPDIIRRYACHVGTVRLTVNQHRDGRRRMRVEASLPKVLFGQNISLLNAVQVTKAIIALQSEVKRLSSYVTISPVATWELSEVHWCDAWCVDSPSAVISALAATVPQTKAQRTTRENDGRGGQTYRRQPRGARGEWSEQIYDKAAETMALLAKGKIDLGKCGLSAEQVEEMARGMLRFEVVTRRKALRAILGPEPTVARLYDYLAANGSAFIQARWDRLSANLKPTPIADVARDLRANYAVCTAADLFNFWVAVSQLGVAEYQQLTQVAPEKWRRQVNRLKEVGLGLRQPGHPEWPNILSLDG